MVPIRGFRYPLAMAKDPYALLGVARDASSDDIKRAYRKLSKEWHPDKHKGDKDAETKFKEINEAYEILHDSQKKERYDRFGDSAGFNGAQGFPGFDFSGFSSGGLNDFADIFEGFFGARTSRATRETGGDLQVEIAIDLQGVLNGTQQSLQLRTHVRCEACSGSGAAPGGTLVTCGECGGTGQVTRSAQSFFGMIQQRVICGACGGSGKVPSEPCATCRGEGRVSGRREVTVHVPAGIEDGQTLRIRGEGEAGRRSEAAGDLYATVRVRPDARFERAGTDIRSSMTIHVLDAILGAEKEVETLHGNVTLAIPEGTQPNQVLRIKGKGLPLLSTSRHGDHYVTISVEIPRKLSRAERKLLEEWREML